MIFKRTIAYIMTAAVLLSAVFTFSACRDSDNDNPDKGKNAAFTSVISGSPATLDPQTCTNDSSAQIISDIFLGLYRAGDGGEIVPAMAESSETSEDGLVRTFKLKQGVKWYGSGGFSEECTADDFVFAFRRLMDPALGSEHAKEYYCIKNAEKTHTGQIGDASQLGVEAVSRYELRITLNEPRTDLNELLAAAPAMPCNRKFWEQTEGQYGLVGNCVGSNGGLYVSRWHYDKWTKDGNFVELKRNPENADILGVTARSVTYMINADGYESFMAGMTDVYRTSDPDEIFRLSGKYDANVYRSSVWGVVFNSAGLFAERDLRVALGGCVSADTDNENYTPASCIIPDGTLAGNADYRKTAGYPELAAYSESELTERGERALRELPDGALSGMKLLIPEGTALKQSAGVFIQRWQKSFGINCTITELPYDSYLSALHDGAFDAALIRIGAHDAQGYLSAFMSSSAQNYGGADSRKLDDIITCALTAADDKSAARYCLEAEQFILDSGYFAPLCFGSEYVFLGKGVSDIGYDPSAGVYIFDSALIK
ncbi:MAG: peptide ABC transporter substrate-binding protein [Ruminiclostridium sp.]|nr:peptide ABC transporter substrate-binding protein [Ruminiclostridium sp.]